MTETMPRHFGLREYMVYRVRRGSLTEVLQRSCNSVVSCTREGFEPMEPFKDDV